MEDEGHNGWRIIRPAKGRGVVQQCLPGGVAGGNNQQGGRQKARLTMTASTIAQAIPAEGVPREIVIIAREPDKNITTPIMIAACVTGLVLILKAMFMPRALVMGRKKGKNLMKGVAKVPVQKGGIQGQSNCRSYGIGTSMVCGKGSKTCW
jgi:hypothetical protein